jgi:integrase
MEATPMTGKLTENRVSGAPVPKTGQVFLWDSAVRGFGVRILPGKSRTFWFMYRPRGGGSSRMVSIGKYPAIKVAAARKVASTFYGQVARGEDPAAKRQVERTRDQATLRTLLADDGPYQRELKRRHLVNAKQALSSLNRGLRRLLSKEVTALTRSDLVAAITAIEDDGRPGAAQDLRKFARTFLEWCVSSGRITANPLAGLRQPKRSRAERLKAASNGGRALSDDEICKMWQAAASLGSFGGLVRLALLTGLRRGELAQIERARDLRADRIVVQPEHAKTGAQHEVPLTPLMRQVIDGEPVTTSPLLFPSPVTGGRLKGWTKLTAKLRRASGVDFTLHDLRRTARTLMSRLGVGEDIAELAIGHVRADLIARYNKDAAWAGRSDAFERVNAHVAALIGPRCLAKHLPFGAKRASQR